MDMHKQNLFYQIVTVNKLFQISLIRKKVKYKVSKNGQGI